MHESADRLNSKLEELSLVQSTDTAPVTVSRSPEVFRLYQDTTLFNNIVYLFYIKRPSEAESTIPSEKITRYSYYLLNFFVIRSVQGQKQTPVVRFK